MPSDSLKPHPAAGTRAAARIAVVEDDPELSALLEYNLVRNGFECQTFGGTRETVAGLEACRPSLILLDVMLPELSGFDICRAVRRSANLSRTPVLFLTARSEEVDRVLGLELGGDDYIVKPFSTRELLARIKAHLRRVDRETGAAPSAAGAFRLDRSSRKAYLYGRGLDLTGTEYNLLEYFVLHPGRVCTREQVLDAVWREQRFITPRTIDVHIRRLREQIEEHPGEPKYLLTVRGFGYRFEA